MSRIIEIVLFLTPLLGFFLWRLVLPAPVPPLWLVGGLTTFMAILLLALLWLRHLDADDANKAYVPAQLQDDHVVPAHPAPRP